MRAGRRVPAGGSSGRQGGIGSFAMESRGPRDGGSFAVIPSRPAPSPSIPGVPHGFSAARIASGEAPLGETGLAASVCFRKSASPFSPRGGYIPLPCFLPPRNPRGPWDPARTAPGAMGPGASPAPDPCKSGIGRFSRPMPFRCLLVRWSRPFGVLGLTMHDGNMSRKQWDRVNLSNLV